MENNLKEVSQVETQNQNKEIVIHQAKMIDITKEFKNSNQDKASFICKSKELKTQLKKIIGVIGKGYMPIFETFRVNILDGRVTFQATNLETSAKVTIDCETVGTGKLCINAKQLMDYLNVIQDCNIILAAKIEKVGNGNMVTIQIGRNGGNLATWGGYDADEFPVWKSPKIKRNTIDISAPFFINGLNKTINFCGTDSLRPVMNGINFEVSKENIKFVSTNAHKLAVQILHKRERNYKTFGFDVASFIIPKEGAKHLILALKNESSIVELSFTKYVLTVAFNNVKFRLRLVEGKYPNYNAVIPIENDKVLYANRKELIQAVKTVSLSANKSTNQVRFALNGICQISASDLDFGLEQTEYVKDFCFSQNEIFEIGFNSKLMLEILKDLDCEYINVEMSQPNKAALIIPQTLERNEQFLSLLMPLVLNS